MKKFLQNNYYIAICFIFTAIAFLAGKPVLANDTRNPDIMGTLGKTAETPFGAPKSGYANRTPGQLVGELVKIALGFVGTIAFIVFLYGGFLWLTARGSEEQVTKAKKYLTNGAIGTIVIILAYAGTYFITEQLYYATT